MMNQIEIENNKIAEKERDKKLFPRPRILIFCGNGYILNEVYLPVVNELSVECSFDVLVADYYLASHAKSLLERLSSTKKIDSFRIIQPFEQRGSMFSYHKRMQLTAQLFLWEGVGLLLLGTDCDIFDR